MADKMTVGALTERIAEYGYVQGGVQSGTFLSSLRTPRDTVVVALNNAESDGALAALYRTDADALMRGALLLCAIHGASRLTVHIPASAERDTLPFEVGDSAGIQVTFAVGNVNRRAYPDAAFCHAVTAVNVAAIADGTYTEGIYASVDGSALQKYDPEMTVGALLTACGAETSHVSALISGYRLCGADVLSRPLFEIYPENGSIRVIGDGECVVRCTAERLRDAYAAGCGKCVFCREGLNQLASAVKDIAEGKGKPAQIDIIREIGSAMKNGTLCTLGQNRGDIALDLVNAFEHEVIRHIKRKKCTSGVCFSNDTYYVDPMRCDGCGACQNSCPVRAVDGLRGYIHMIDPSDCTSCGACVSACPQSAIRVTRSKPPRLPDRLTRVGHFKEY